MSNTRLRVATSGPAANANDIGGLGTIGSYLKRVANVNPLVILA